MQSHMGERQYALYSGGVWSLFEPRLAVRDRLEKGKKEMNKVHQKGFTQ